MRKKNEAAPDDNLKKFSPVKRAALEAYRRTFGNIKRTCDAVDITRQTFYNWKRDDVSFAAALEEIDPVGALVDLAEDGLAGKVKEGDLKAIVFVLETKGAPRGWTKTANVAISGPPPLVVQTEEVGFFDVPTLATARQTTIEPVGDALEKPAKKTVKKAATRKKTTKKNAKKTTRTAKK